MNIVWFSWKDINHPLAGGAEVITDNILSRLSADGHNVSLLTSAYNEASSEDTINGYSIIRRGGRLTVYFATCFYYFKYLRNDADLVIDEVNTIPFFAKLFTSKQTKTYLFVHMLCRQIWFYQLAFPLSLLGYISEPVYLFVLSLLCPSVITVSDSTKQDLRHFGFKEKNIKIVSEGISIKPIAKLPPKKFTGDLVYLGSIRPMKQTLDAVKGFHGLVKKHPAFHLSLAGDDSGGYVEKVKKYCKDNLDPSSFEFLGRISQEEKTKLLQRASAILVTSVKEGWGLIVTEANSQGTPAVVYDVDGLRDSVRHMETGIVVRPNPSSLAKGVVVLDDSVELYDGLRRTGWDSSKSITFDRSYKDFLRIVVTDNE